MTMRVVVTGASGFVGSCVVELLDRQGEFDIVPTSRRAHAGGRVARFGLSLVAADLTSADSTRRLVQGADAVVHCAFGGDSDQQAAIDTLLDAATQAGVKKFIHVSTAEVYAARSGTIDESSPLGTDGPSYGAVKARIDKTVQDRAAAFASTVVLRPPIIYGPTSDTWTVRPIKRAWDTGWYPEGDGYDGICNIVHIADLSGIIARLLTDARPGLSVYNVVGPDRPTWGTYFQGLIEATGFKPLPATAKKKTDSPVASGLAALQRAIPTDFKQALGKQMRKFGPSATLLAGVKKVTESATTPGEKELYSRRAVYSTDRLEGDGFGCRIGMAEGLRHCADWALQVGLTE